MKDDASTTPLAPMADPAAVRAGVVLDLTEDGGPQSPGDMIPDARAL